MSPTVLGLLIVATALASGALAYFGWKALAALALYIPALIIIWVLS